MEIHRLARIFRGVVKFGKRSGIPRILLQAKSSIAKNNVDQWLTKTVVLA
jgi:hypothetical protein